MAPIEIDGLGVSFLAAEPGTEYLGGTQTRPVVFVSYKSQPSYIYFQVPVPQAIYSAAIAKAAAMGVATILETLNALPWVGGVSWGQLPTLGGELNSTATIEVVSTSGNSAALLGPWALVSLPPDLNQPKITALHNELDATENT